MSLSDSKKLTLKMVELLRKYLRMGRLIQPVFFFSIFPSSVLPAHQIFVEKKDRMLVRVQRVECSGDTLLLAYCHDFGSGSFACISINISHRSANLQLQSVSLRAR